jgi:predicted Zn-dependent peptidase
MESESALKELAIKPPGNFKIQNLSQPHSVAVYVGAGSRHEDLETSGSAYLLEKMLFRGTTSRSKSDF